MMILLAGVGSVVAEAVAKRRDSACSAGRPGRGRGRRGRAVHRPQSRPSFVAGMAVYGLGLGMVDASTNMQAVALEHRYERPILPSFHGAWTLGGVLGAAVALATADLPLEAGDRALRAYPLAVACAPFLPRDQGPTELPDALAVPWRPILLVGLAMVLFYMVDTAVQTWGPLFLDHTFGTPDRYVALSALSYLLASGLVRLAGDRLVAALGPRRRAADRRGDRRGRPRGRGLLPHLAGRRPRLRDPRCRRRGGRAAELLGRRPDRRR